MSEKSIVSGDDNVKTHTDVTESMKENEETLCKEEDLEQSSATHQQNKDDTVTSYNEQTPTVGESLSVVHATTNYLQLYKNSDYLIANKNVTYEHGCLENLDTPPKKCKVLNSSFSKIRKFSEISAFCIKEYGKWIIPMKLFSVQLKFHSAIT